MLLEQTKLEIWEWITLLHLECTTTNSSNIMVDYRPTRPYLQRPHMEANLNITVEELMMWK